MLTAPFVKERRCALADPTDPRLSKAADLGAGTFTGSFPRVTYEAWAHQVLDSIGLDKLLAVADAAQNLMQDSDSLNMDVLQTRLLDALAALPDWTRND